MFDNVTITYRGATYEIGRGWDFYGVWTVGGPRSRPLERWPETPEGWTAAWTRFVSIEAPDTIVPVGRNTPPVGAGAREGREPGPFGGNAVTPAGAAISGKASRIMAAALLGAGVILGIAGLFPAYIGGNSLAQQPDQVIPHAIYLATWTASAVLILLGGARLRLGALLSLGLTAVTFGLFLADAGMAISAGRTAGGGSGLVLSLIGWVACAAGTVVACLAGPVRVPRRRPRRPAGRARAAARIRARPRGAGHTGRPWGGRRVRPVVGQLHAAHGGRAGADADRGQRLLQSRPGDHRGCGRDDRVRGSRHRGRALAPGPARSGAAGRRHDPDGGPGYLGARPGRRGSTSSQFGVPPATARQLGLTISAGLTPAFWIYFGFLIALIVSCAWMLFTPQPVLATPAEGSSNTGRRGDPTPGRRSATPTGTDAGTEASYAARGHDRGRCPRRGRSDGLIPFRGVASARR